MTNHKRVFSEIFFPLWFFIVARPYGLAMVGEVRAFRPLQSSNSILHLLNLSSIKAIVIPSYRIGFNVFGDAIHFILIANNMIVIT